MLYQKGTTFNLIGNSGKLLPKLPFGFYQIVETMAGIHLEKLADPHTVPNLTGTAKEAMDTMITLWNSSTSKNPSVMLTGTSGNGKTQTALNVAKATDLPILLVNGQPMHIIMAVLECVGGPVMLLFDEFEKNYSSADTKAGDPSADLLTFFDGLTTAVKVFNVMTVNERRNLSKFLFNRPGRILFDFKFDPLTVDVALDFIKEQTTVNDPERLKAFLEKVSDLSYDICDKIAYVVDMYPDTFDQVLPHMNIEVGIVTYNSNLMQQDEKGTTAVSFKVSHNAHDHPHYDWYKGRKEYRFRLANPKTIGILLAHSSFVDIPLEDLHVHDADTGKKLLNSKLEKEPFKGLFLRVERTIEARKTLSSLSLAY